MSRPRPYRSGTMGPVRKLGNIRCFCLNLKVPRKIPHIWIHDLRACRLTYCNRSRDHLSSRIKGVFACRKCVFAFSLTPETLFHAKTLQNHICNWFVKLRCPGVEANSQKNFLETTLEGTNPYLTGFKNTFQQNVTQPSTRDLPALDTKKAGKRFRFPA